MNETELTIEANPSPPRECWAGIVGWRPNSWLLRVRLSDGRYVCLYRNSGWCFIGHSADSKDWASMDGKSARSGAFRAAMQHGEAGEAVQLIAATAELMGLTLYSRTPD